MKRLLVTTLAISAVLISAIPAQAKVVGTASIGGPGIGGPGAGAGDDGGGISMNGTDGAGYPVMAGLFDGSQGTQRPPTEALGPRYVARFEVRQPTGQPPIVQHLYPYAAGGPLLYTAPGQEWLGGADGTAPSGWFRMSPELLDELIARGLPESSPIPVRASIGDQPRPSPAPGSPPVLWDLILLAGLLVVAAMAGHRRAAVRRAA